MTNTLPRRPPPRMGKGATLNARITLETRNALEREAERSGRSISEVAEDWLEEARRGSASFEGVPHAGILRRMAQAARAIGSEIGDPLENLEAHGALSGAWNKLVEDGLKDVPLTPLVLQVADLEKQANKIIDHLKLIISTRSNRISQDSIASMRSILPLGTDDDALPPLHPSSFSPDNLPGDVVSLLDVEIPNATETLRRYVELFTCMDDTIDSGFDRGQDFVAAAEGRSKFSTEKKIEE